MIINDSNQNIERFLAIDYGEKRVGLAITDPLRIFAYPLETFLNDNNFWKRLKKVFDSYNIVKIIIGYPFKENGEKSSSTKLIEEFAKELQNKTSIQIEFYDERYSSEIARQRVIESVSSKKKRRDKGLIDKNAAAVFLQDYLSEMK
ncbi:MAG: Holliday junction resolvase RuvX [Bacteroidetes bacterium]|nr:Holliday junction resolvase RuvX [Bacteroidota bacterium]MBU1677621.1 Holliday junction resolvase RuvX [Bacteroidota bacterium]MBU2508040.1 Holliday junction resolvase RuvX [Bacteroidota bacterium]